jgi:hypothetical protein
VFIVKTYVFDDGKFKFRFTFEDEGDSKNLFNQEIGMQA